MVCAGLKVRTRALRGFDVRGFGRVEHGLKSWLQGFAEAVVHSVLPKTLNPKP